MKSMRLSALVVSAVLLGVPVSIGYAQQPSAMPDSGIGFKLRSPTTARTLAIIPGAGHIYTGEGARGVRTLFATIGGLTLGSWLIQMDGCGLQWSGCDATSRSQVPYQVAGGGLIVVSVYLWVSSYRDAPASAVRANQRREKK